MASAKSLLRNESESLFSFHLLQSTQGEAGGEKQLCAKHWLLVCASLLYNLFLQ